VDTAAGPDRETIERYRRQGWGETRIGFGTRPALLVVDMQNDFVDPASPSTCAPLAQERMPAIRRLLDEARGAAIPVFFSQGLVSPDLVDVGFWKSAPQQAGKCQVEGTAGAEIVADLAPLPGERVIRKRRPSVFFRSDLDVFLVAHHVDTLILAGSSMSGCVRATAVDAFSRDYRVMIVRDCVIDRTLDVLERNLFDVDAKYADAVTLDETIAYLGGIRDERSAAPRSTSGERPA
jgi:maleamate amidohydrolase